jgi:uncharacterized protein (DUF697 family)
MNTVTEVAVANEATAPKPLEKEVAPPNTQDRLTAAETLVRKSVYAAAGVGLLPLPLVDLAAFNGIQLNMLYRLCKRYEVPFSKQAAKGFIGMLLSGGGAALLTAPAWSLLKSIPVVGSALGGMTVSALAGASTYALGKVFIEHFESGGTFLTFDPKAAKARFEQLQKEGRKAVQEASQAKQASA